MNLTQIILKLKEIPTIKNINEGMTFVKFNIGDNVFTAHDGDQVIFNLINRKLYLNDKTIAIRDLKK